MEIDTLCSKADLRFINILTFKLCFLFSLGRMVRCGVMKISALKTRTQRALSSSPTSCITYFLSLKSPNQVNAFYYYDTKNNGNGNYYILFENIILYTEIKEIGLCVFAFRFVFRATAE